MWLLPFKVSFRQSHLRLHEDPEAGADEPEGAPSDGADGDTSEGSAWASRSSSMADDGADIVPRNLEAATRSKQYKQH